MIFTEPPMPKRTERGVLSLNLMRKYFDAIAAGTKKTEFREYKSYWRTHIEPPSILT
jgi:hypothetical protein